MTATSRTLLTSWAALDAKSLGDESQGDGADLPEAPIAGGGPAVANSIARVDPQARVGAGERIEFAVDVERLHFFDPATGSALGLEEA